MWRGKIHPSSRDLSNACQKLLSSIYFKLRRLRPYIICSLDFKADFNEENELQLSVYGTSKKLSLLIIEFKTKLYPPPKNIPYTYYNDFTLQELRYH